MTAVTPGKKARRWTPPNHPDLPALPVRENRGHGPGPHLLVTAGVHGDEYEGPAALQSWYAELDPANLVGSITLLPVVNVGGCCWQGHWCMTPNF